MKLMAAAGGLDLPLLPASTISPPPPPPPSPSLYPATQLSSFNYPDMCYVYICILYGLVCVCTDVCCVCMYIVYTHTHKLEKLTRANNLSFIGRRPPPHSSPPPSHP